MKFIEILVLVFAVALVLFTILFNLVGKHSAKKKGTKACFGGCNYCPHSGSCKEQNENTSKRNDAST